MSFVTSIFNFLRFNKRNWKAVVLCIFAATVFWFFNALNKNYSTNISFPVTFDYDQDNYIAVKSLPQNVRMNVTGSGWDLFRRSLGFKVPPLVIPLEKPADTRKLVGATLPAIFAGQLERLKINFVITDTVRLHIEEKLKKKAVLRLDSVQQFIADGFGAVEPPRIIPDTVWLEGPEALVASLPATLQIELPKKNLREDFKDEVELNLNNTPLLNAQPDRVSVSVRIEKLEEVRKRVRLEIVNIPSRLKQGAAIKEVYCAYRLPVSLARNFTGDSLRAVIDLKNKPKGSYKLVPQIVGLPAVAHLIRTDTVVVNF